MDEHNSEHGEHAEVHLPNPSVWPLVVGLAALLMGLALVYWTRDRHSNFAGPLLGAGVLGILISASGWAYEDGRMKRRAEAHEMHGPRDARFTQVLTFGVAEGRLGIARTTGILAAIEQSDSVLRDLAGFQDMRIIASPAEAGPSQVLVETTWSDREGLATYEETRATMLDVVAKHPDDVVPGSVQVFDMEVVRDTKDVAFRFGLGAAAAVFGSLAIGGLMVGAGLTAFQKNDTASAGGGGGTTPAADPYAVTATDNKFAQASLEAPPNTSVTFTLTNKGNSIHNLHFYDKKGGQTLASGAGTTDGSAPKGQTETLTFTTPGDGTYYFQCDFHPDQMNGTFTVKAGAAGTGGATGPPGGGGSTAAATISTTGTTLKFDKASLSATAGQPYTITFDNTKSQTLHNLHFYDKKNGTTLAAGADGQATVSGGKSETITFTVATAGVYYFQCDLHPDQMNGVFTVK
jgi:plastocyanin